jgi:hypothetical protein
VEAQKNKEAATKAAKSQADKDEATKQRMQSYQTANTLNRKFIAMKDALTVLAHHDLMFLHF